MPEVTGYQLREAIKIQETLKIATVCKFEWSLKKFEDEEKESPIAIDKVIRESDYNIAHLRTAQSAYNLLVEVEVRDRKMPLAQAIKLVGGAGALEKMWRLAAAPKVDRYAARDDLVRRADEIHQKPTISSQEATGHAISAAKWAGALRAAIAEGNGVKANIDFLNPELL